MASLFSSFSAAPVEVEVKLTGEEDRKQVEVKGDKDQKVMCPVYYDGESVVGQVCQNEPLVVQSFLVTTIYLHICTEFGQLLTAVGACTDKGWQEVPARRYQNRAHRVYRYVPYSPFATGLD